MLDEITKIEAKNLAQNALRAFFGLEKLEPKPPRSPTLLEKRGVFVTLHYKSKLRGCLGDIETDQPLHKSIQELAVASATKDWRFNPVTKAELPEIEIEISVLTVPKKINDWKKIELGRHGVIVEQSGHKGVFLPQVAEEGKFTLEEFLGLLCTQKAGLPAEAYKDSKTGIFIFEAEVF